MDFGQSSEHPKTCKGREENVQMHGETSDHHSIKDKQANKISETTNDHSNSKDSSHESGSISDSEGEIDVIRRDESNKSNNHSDAHIKSMSSSDKKSSSSSLSESSSDDLFGTEKAFKYSKPDESILASKSGKDCVSSSENYDKSEVDNSLLVPISTEDIHNLSHSQKIMSPTATPPVQLMDRSGRPEASRIPSWVFDGNTNQSEWSLASNDSLFSIHLGQPSFSREMTLNCGKLDVSGELTKSRESSNQAASVIDDEMDTTIKSVVENLQTTESSHGSFKSEGEELKEYNKIKNTSYKSSKSTATASSLSESSETGMFPTNLPLKKKKKKKRSRRWCYYKCSKMFCSFWPSSKCSDSCGAFSCCWIYNRTKYRPHTSPILTDAEKSDSTKMDIPQQELEIKEPEVTNNSTSSSCSCFGSKQESGATSKSSDSNSKWFNCFSCSSCSWISCTCCERCR